MYRIYSFGVYIYIRSYLCVYGYIFSVYIYRIYSFKWIYVLNSVYIYTYNFGIYIYIYHIYSYKWIYVPNSVCIIYIVLVYIYPFKRMYVPNSMYIYSFGVYLYIYIHSFILICIGYILSIYICIRSSGPRLFVSVATVRLSVF